jgi:hypothetical protein
MEMIGRSAETKSEDDWLFYGHAPDLNLNDLLLTPSGKQALEQLHASHPKHALAILRNLLEMDGLPLTPGSVFPYLPSEIARDFPKSVTDKDALRQMAYFSDSNIMEVIPEDGMDILEECSFTNEVMLTWATGDPESAGLWLNAMPPSPGLDRAVYGYIAAISDLYPADATSWLSKISDSATRLEASRILFSKWQRLSSTAAQAWIQESSLSAIERRFVCNPWGDRRGEN